MTKHGEFGMYVMAITYLSKILFLIQCVRNGLRLQPIVIMTIGLGKNQGILFALHGAELP
jgi:hypothetical protein